MNLIFSDKAWEEYMYWQNTDKQILKKINQLIKENHLRVLVNQNH